MISIIDLVMDTVSFGIWSGYKNQQKMDEQFRRYMMERKPVIVKYYDN